MSRPQPIEGFMQIRLGGDFEREPPCLLHLHGPDVRVFLEASSNRRGLRIQFEHQRVRRSHAASAGQRCKHLVPAVQGGKTEKGACAYLGPVGNLIR